MAFHLVNDESDLEKDQTVICWIPNPGQRFIAGQQVNESFPNLKAVVTPSTGSNHVDRQLFETRGIPVFSLLDDRASLDSIRASSEFTLLLLLASLRKMRNALHELDEGRWRHREEVMRGREIEGRRIGIVGLGRNGGNMAHWLEAMQARVSYYDPCPRPRPGRVDSLEQLFAESEIVVLTLPLNDETRGLIGRSLLDMLPEQAHLINTSRGEIIDEQALTDFLKERPDISFAADVVCGEVEGHPLQSSLYELYLKGRILLTPHIAGATIDSQTKAARAAVELAVHFLETGK